MTKARFRGKVRKRVYDVIKDYPGLHVRGVEAQLKISGPLAHYHLRKLEEAGFIQSREVGGYVRFYPTTKGRHVEFTDTDKEVLGFLREEIPLGILLYLLDEGATAHKDLVERLDVAPSTVSYHLGKLTRTHIVHQTENRTYEVTDPDRVHALLLAYNPTPDLIDTFADIWKDLYG